MGALGLPGSYVVDLILLLLPVTACSLVAARLEVTHWLLLLAAGIGGSGVLAVAVFWAYLASARYGGDFAVVITVASAAVLLEACRGGYAAWKALRPLLPVTALFAAAGFFNTAMAYLHEKFAAQPNPGVTRYLIGLPKDNILPWIFARQLEAKARPLPALLVRGWQSSDRPPLQTGYDLMQHAVLGTARFDDYVLLGILLQGFWIIGLWALLRSMGRESWAVAACLTASVFNGFVLQNTVFTWPKLLAAAGPMLAVAIVCTRQFPALRRSRAAGVLTGAVAGCGMTGHPGSAFALGGAAVVIAALWLLPRLRPAWWQPPTWRFLWPVGTIAALCYAPWSLYYTKHYQPPANALTELQLADTPGPVPGKTTTQVIVGAYKHAGLHNVVSNKISNMVTPFRHTLDYLHWTLSSLYHELTGNHAAAAKAAHLLVTAQFFNLGAILGLTGWGLIVLYGRAVREFAARRRGSGGSSGIPLRAPAELDQEYILLAIVGVYALAWCLVLFGPTATVAHQGTYFTEPVLIALGILGFWTISRRLAIAVAVISATLTLWLYITFTPVSAIMTNASGAHNTDAATHHALAYLVVAIAACVAALSWIGMDKFDYCGPVIDAALADIALPQARAESTAAEKYSPSGM